VSGIELWFVGIIILAVGLWRWHLCRTGFERTSNQVDASVPLSNIGADRAVVLRAAVWGLGKLEEVVTSPLCPLLAKWRFLSSKTMATGLPELGLWAS